MFCQILCTVKVNAFHSHLSNQEVLRIVLASSQFLEATPFPVKVTGSRQRKFTSLKLPREFLRFLNFYVDPALLKDGLNFDDRILKAIGFL